MGVRNSRATLKRKGETREQLNTRLTQEMRSSGQEYLRKNPQAFGGGIDPETGVRYVEGVRVSVTTPEEEASGVSPITRQLARKLSSSRKERLIEKTRERGREYLARNRKAFGGGIDPSSGIDINREYKQFQADLKSGKILGFSGSGLTAQEEAKRKFLIRIGALVEGKSIPGKPFASVDKLPSEYFLDTRPTKSDKQNLMQYLKSEQFSVAKVNLYKKQNILQKILNGANKASEYLSKIKTALDKKIDSRAKEQIIKTNTQKLKKEKRNLILNLVKAKVMSDRWNKKQVDLFALGVVSGLVSFSQFVVQTPALAYSVKVGTVPFIKKFKENPIRQIKSGYAISKNLIKSIAKKGYAIGKIAILNPGYALGLIAGELVILEASGGAWKIVGKASGGLTRQLSKGLNPYFRKIENGKIVLRKVPEEIFEVYDKKRFLESRVKTPSFKRPFSSLGDLISGRKPGQFKRFAKDAGLVIKEQTVASGATSLSRQARLAGRTVTAVNASAEQLTSLLRRKKIIRKPIPGEESFPIKIRQLLSKFDSGKKLSNKEFTNVNSWLRKNVAPNITLLERSLYLDPAGGLRTSRLGIQPTKYATIRDILRGNFRLWASAGKPQVLIFENAKIANFPKSLQSIKRKLLADKPLTTAETNKLIRWQVQTGSGKFKPIGSTIYAGGKELEVTLAPGEMIKRIKRIGFTYIQGKKVNFVTAEIFKPSKAILSAIKKANMGKLSKSQITSLEKLLSKKLGRKIKVETPELRKSFIRRANRADQNIPVLRIRGRGVFVSKLFRGFSRPTRVTPKRMSRVTRPTTKRPGRVTRSGRVTRPTTKRPSRATRAGRATRSGRVTRPTTKRPSRATRAGRVVRPGKRAKRIIPRPKIKQFQQRRLSESQPVYYVLTRKRGKLVKLYAKPLTLKDARDYLAYSVDNNLTRSAWFHPLGKSRTVVSLPNNMKGYFSRISNKLRPYKIRYGRKKRILNGYIEKSKFFKDTSGERGQLKNLRRVRTKRNSPISNSLQRQRLRNLIKARRRLAVLRRRRR